MHLPTTNRRNPPGQRGSTSLEFAFVLLLLLFPLIFGIIDFSRALYAYHWTAYAAREATRWASVRGVGCNTTNPLPGGCPATPAQIQTFVQGIVAPGMYSVPCNGGDSNAGCVYINTTNSFVWPGVGGDGASCLNGGSNPSNSAGCIVQVEVDYIFGFSLPYIGNVTGTTLHLKSTSQTVIAQ